MALWSHPDTGVVARLQQWIASTEAHPGRTLVLLPYAQLLPLARRIWAQLCPHGFAPRFETTSNLLASLGGRVLQATDISFDVALDSLTAQHLLAGSGVPDPAAMTGLLVETAHQLAPYAAAAGPDGREAWAAEARHVLAAGMDGPALAWEARVLQVAVEWAAVSAFDSDVLFEDVLADDWDAIALVEGLAADPVSTTLQVHWGERARLFMLAPRETPTSRLCRRCSISTRAWTPKMRLSVQQHAPSHTWLLTDIRSHWCHRTGHSHVAYGPCWRRRASPCAMKMVGNFLPVVRAL